MIEIVPSAPVIRRMKRSFSMSDSENIVKVLSMKFIDRLRDRRSLHPMLAACTANGRYDISTRRRSGAQADGEYSALSRPDGDRNRFAMRFDDVRGNRWAKTGAVDTLPVTAPMIAGRQV